MEKITILNPHKDSIEVEVLRYFVMGEAKILLYTLGEKDDDGNVRLYATKINNKQTADLSDEEWTYVKASIRTIVNENREGKTLTVQDLDYNEVAGIVVENLKIFKLAGAILDDLSANKKEFKKPEVVIPSFEEKDEEEDSFETMLNSTSVLEDSPIISTPVTVDYKSMYEKAEQEKKRLEEELFDIQSKTMSYQIKYDQIKKILEGSPINNEEN